MTAAAENPVDDGLDPLVKKDLLKIATAREVSVNPKRSKGAIVAALRAAGATAQDLPADAPSDEPPADEGIFVQRIALDDGGFAIGRIEPFGDVRLSEFDSVLKKARKVWAERAELD